MTPNRPCLPEPMFAMICFIVLMQNGAGLKDKAPVYVQEKSHILRAGYEAFAYLDIYNMRKVVEWHQIWKISLPDIAKKEMDAQEGALLELQDKGIFL